jgi:DNA polymerase eta
MRLVLARGVPSHPGGKLGQRVKADFNIQYAGELAGISRQALCRKYGDKTGAWLHLVARGEACEPVKDRLIPKSIGCVCVGWRSHPQIHRVRLFGWCSRSLVTWPWTVLPWRPNVPCGPHCTHRCSKTFPGPLALTTVAKVSQWLHELASELEEVGV